LRAQAAARWRRPAVLGAVAVAGLFVVLRVPSLVEPAQFSDEGTYADIGWALNHGAVLYRDVWDNKPPGVYWLAAALTRVSTSVLAFHLLALLIAALGALAVWLLARRLAPARVAFAAACAFVVLSSLPTLAGDVFTAEALGALLSVTAVLSVSGPARRLPSLLLGGALAAAALLTKATYAADLAAVFTLPLLLAPARGMPFGAGLRASLAVAAGALAVVGAALLALALSGSLGGFLDVLLHQDLSYLQQVGINGAVAAAAPPATALTLLTVTRTAALLGAGLLAALLLARRRSVAGSLVVWVLAWQLAGAMLSARGLVQYVQQAEPMLCVAAALLLGRVLPRAHAAVLAAGSAALAWCAAIAVLLLPMAELSLVQPQPLRAAVAADASPRAVTHVLGLGWQRVFGLITTARFEAGFGDEPRVLGVTLRVLGARSAADQRVYVWGRLPWVYAQSARLPAGRYVTLNAAFVVDPQAEQRLEQDLASHPPAVVVVLQPLPASAQALFARLGYQPAGELGEELLLAQTQAQP
jgi:hypothetical protein